MIDVIVQPVHRTDKLHFESADEHLYVSVACSSLTSAGAARVAARTVDQASRNWPPSTWIALPVMPPERGDARNTQAQANSAIVG